MSTTEHNFQGSMILIVDDTPKNLQLIGSILMQEKFKISVAKNGKEALKVVKNVNPDLILLDIMMPEMDGFETCKHLKESNETRNIPIIFLTAKIETDDIVKAFETGAVDYIIKPFNPKELLVRVNTHLELKFAHEKIRKSEQELRNANEELKSQRDQLAEQRNNAFRQKEQIEKQNKSITDSINYAKRIQSALLPPKAYISELLHENFIFNKPKDIVSGDFYWVKQVNQFIILVVADCTGHGVPGAFMSMLGISFLNEIVVRREVTEANKILNELRRQIKHSLRQHGDTDGSKDGMDTALCVIDTKTNILQYSGAFNPLYLIREINEKPELKEYKADRMPVGFYGGKDRSFTNHNIQLEIGDTFYLSTDGYSDQTGGKNEKKFLSKNLKELLLKIHEKPLHEQKRILDGTLEKWMNGYEQVDDILVVGVRI